jgi:hypothetical protein
VALLLNSFKQGVGKWSCTIESWSLGWGFVNF